MDGESGTDRINRMDRMQKIGTRYPDYPVIPWPRPGAGRLSEKPLPYLSTRAVSEASPPMEG